MNKNIIIIFAGALVVAVLVALMMQMMLGGKKKPVDIAQEPKTQILVAAKDLKLGSTPVEGDVKWQEWPQSATFSGSIQRKDNQKSIEAATGRLARDVGAGEPLTPSAFVGGKGVNLVAANLEEGMRAVAIPVTASTTVGGFVTAGDFVDIMLTYKGKIKTSDKDPRVQAMIDLNFDKYATETILQNVKVLAVDQKATRPEDDKVKVGKTVTVAVNAQDAERLALARELGDLTLTLRGIGDENIVEKDWPTISDARLTKMDDEIYSEFKKMKDDTGAEPDTMRIYNGTNVQAVPTK